MISSRLKWSAFFNWVLTGWHFFEKLKNILHRSKVKRAKGLGVEFVNFLVTIEKKLLAFFYERGYYFENILAQLVMF